MILATCQTLVVGSLACLLTNCGDRAKQFYFVHVHVVELAAIARIVFRSICDGVFRAAIRRRLDASRRLRRWRSLPTIPGEVIPVAIR